jgi:hypothetical protein
VNNMQTHITPNNKLASLGTVGLLFLAGIAGIVFLLPASPVHAASPTVTLSASSGTVGSTLVITGDGFDSNAYIGISTTVSTTTLGWLVATGSGSTCTGTFTGLIGGVGNENSLYTGTGASACLTTTATGMFETSLTVPALPGGAETIVVTDGVNTVSTPFTITPAVILNITPGTRDYGFPTESISGSITVTGYAADESVTGSTTAFTTASLGGFTCTTGSTISSLVTSATSAGTCTLATGPLVVADTTGGSHTIAATGATSGLTSSITYTINPWAAFYNSKTGTTAFSFIGAAPTSIVVEAHGLAAGTIAADSITLGGVATDHAAVTVGSTGEFSQLVVSPVSNVPFGPISAVIDGITFNYASGNIALGIGTWGAPLISSVVGTGTSTGVVSTDAANYKPGTITRNAQVEPTGVDTETSPAPIQNTVGIFGYGFVPGNAITVTAPTGAPFTAITAPGSATPSGAFFSTQALGDTPWSLLATPTTAAAYVIGVTQTSGPANILTPSFGITPWIDTTATSFASVVAFNTNTAVYSVHGFGPTGAGDVVSVTLGGSAVTGASCTAVAGACITPDGQVPDLAGGPQNLAATGSVSGATVTVTGAVSYDPAILGTPAAPSSCTTSCALSVVSGISSSTTILRTGIGFGVHGLDANTEYYIVWNGQQGTYYSFVSTATGGIPVPGVQITIPADTSGIHIIDIQKASSFGTSAIFGGTLQGDYEDSDSGLGLVSPFDHTGFGDMLFLEGASLIATPTVANVGDSTVLSGTGLAANTLYDVGVSIAGVGSSSPASPSTCALGSSPDANPPSTIIGSFTSTSSGAVPAGTSVKITDMATYPGDEQGTLYCAYAQTAATFGSTTATGIAEFELQASATLNMTSAPVGHNVIVSAHALAPSTAYNIIFNPQTSASGVISGTVVGAILSNSVGAGSATITVPSIAAGTYSVELQAVGKTTTDAIAVAPTLTVGSVSTSCNSTTCTAASGATQTTVGTNNGITSTWTNNSNAPVTEYVYAVVHNALGQTVDISTATISVSAGGSSTAFNVLFGLPPGTYSVTLFATSESGVAISASTPVSVTIS